MQGIPSGCISGYRGRKASGCGSSAEKRESKTTISKISATATPQRRTHLIQAVDILQTVPINPQGFEVDESLKASQPLEPLV